MIEVINHNVEVVGSMAHPAWAVTRAARTCYQSESDGKTIEDDINFVRRLIKRGHTAMLEFADVTLRITTDRGVTHELVRHRIASYAQESTRYCDYKDKPIQFIKPVTIDRYETAGHIWYSAVEAAAAYYKDMRSQGASPQEARSVLPNSLKTEIVVKMNMRSFRNFVMLRTAPSAHPDMQYVAKMAVEKVLECTEEYRVFIEDLIGE